MPQWNMTFSRFLITHPAPAMVWYVIIRLDSGLCQRIPSVLLITSISEINNFKVILTNWNAACRILSYLLKDTLIQEHFLNSFLHDLCFACLWKWKWKWVIHKSLELIFLPPFSGMLPTTIIHKPTKPTITLPVLVIMISCDTGICCDPKYSCSIF